MFWTMNNQLIHVGISSVAFIFFAKNYVRNPLKFLETANLIGPGITHWQAMGNMGLPKSFVWRQHCCGFLFSTLEVEAELLCLHVTMIAGSSIVLYMLLNFMVLYSIICTNSSIIIRSDIHRQKHLFLVNVLFQALDHQNRGKWICFSSS